MDEASNLPNDFSLHDHKILSIQSRFSEVSELKFFAVYRQNNSQEGFVRLVLLVEVLTVVEWWKCV